MGSKSKTDKDEIESTTNNRNGTKESKKGKCSGYNKYVDFFLLGGFDRKDLWGRIWIYHRIL